MAREKIGKPSSLQALTDDQRRARIAHYTEEHNQRLAAVADRLESLPNLKAYLTNNPAVGEEIWSNYYIIQRLHDKPQIMPALDANPEVEVQNLILKYSRRNQNRSCVVL